MKLQTKSSEKVYVLKMLNVGDLQKHFVFIYKIKNFKFNKKQRKIFYFKCNQ